MYVCVYVCVHLWYICTREHTLYVCVHMYKGMPESDTCESEAAAMLCVSAEIRQKNKERVTGCQVFSSKPTQLSQPSQLHNPHNYHTSYSAESRMQAPRNRGGHLGLVLLTVSAAESSSIVSQLSRATCLACRALEKPRWRASQHSESSS